MIIDRSAADAKPEVSMYSTAVVNEGSACSLRLFAAAALALAAACSPAKSLTEERPAASSRLAQAYEQSLDQPSTLSVDAATVEEIHVSPEGRDDATGRLTTVGADGALRTLAAAQGRAREVLRAMAQGRMPVRPVHVVLHPGLYRLSQPLNFDERDSGQTGAPVVYRAARFGSVQISGGVEMRSESTYESAVSFSLPADLDVDWQGALQLFVDGRRATLARMPDEGEYWYVLPPSDRASPGSADSIPMDAATRAAFAAMDAQDRKGAVLHLFQSWTTGRHRLEPPANGSTAWTLTPAPRWPFSRFGRSQRFYVENVKAALDSPGEWLGSGRTVTYLPRAQQRGRSLRAVLPVLSTLVSIGASDGSKSTVHDLEFRGIGFEHTAFVTPSAGYIDAQAAVTVGAAIEVNRAQRVVIDRCRVRHVGGYGIWLRKSVKDSTVSNSLLTDLGAGGIRVGDAVGPVRTDRSATTDNRIVANMIQSTGRVLPAGVGIWVGQAWDNEISHNLVIDTTYTGISAGWKWGFGAAVSGGNLIAENLLLNIGQRMLSDLGGIYTLGESPGTVVRGNVIREVRSYPEYGPGGRAGAWGIYQDEGSSDTVVERNIVIGTDSGGYHMHYGRHNDVRGNLFADGDQAELTVSKPDGGAGGVIAADNVFITRSQAPFVKLASPPVVRFRGNLLPERYRTNADLLRRCDAGCEFLDLALEDGAAAKEVSLSGLPLRQVENWQAVLTNAGPAIPELASIPALPIQPTTTNAVRPTAPVRIDIAATPVGGQPMGLNYRPAGSAQAMQVEKRAGPGEPDRCLSFRDGPQFSNAAEPFAFATLGRTSGPWTATFTLWTDGDSNFVHEWRDDEVPYRAGPRLEIERGELRANGKQIASIRPRSWYTFRVSTDLGSDRGTWSLDVTGPDGATQRFLNLPLPDRQWKELRWIGLVSAARNATRACVGTLEVAPSTR